MSKINKQIKFRAIQAYPHVLEVPALYPPEKYPLSVYARDIIRHNKKIILELGCGRGEYSIALGRKYTDTIIVGIDIKGGRLYQGATAALEEGLSNIFFVRTYIDCIDRFFQPGSVSEIWIPFPDPFPRKERRRLTSPVFLEKYRTVLEPGGIVHVKTDDSALYAYTLKTFNRDDAFYAVHAADDLYASEIQLPVTVTTNYEKKCLMKKQPVKYCSFQFRGDSTAGVFEI